MAIVNKRNGEIIAYDFKLCKNVLQQARGLMFSGKKTLVFIFKKEKHTPLHMFFVFFPIDVFFLDNSKKVVEIKKNLKPFAMYNPQKKAKYIIEIPHGLVENTAVEMGDSLEF